MSLTTEQMWSFLTALSALILNSLESSSKVRYAHCARPGVEPRYRQPRRKKATRYYMDEFHLLLKEEQTAAYSVEIWKRFRKWGGIPTAITQNVKDLLSSREVENIFENSDFVLMLNQAQGDRAILAKQLNISPQQMKYVTHTEAGEGLIFYGNVVLPFIDRFPTDTELYRLLTTKPEEVSKA